MSYEDMCQYFARVQICHINDDYHYSFMKASQNVKPNSNMPYTLMRLIVTGSGEHTISVYQKDERCFSRHSEYDYSNVRIILSKIEEDSDDLANLKLKYIKGCSGWDREVHLQVDNLLKGEYYVYVEVDWNEGSEETDFCVTCYGSSKSFFLRDENSLFEKEKFLAKAY